jgi:hypothetical protein
MAILESHKIWSLSIGNNNFESYPLIFLAKRSIEGLNVAEKFKCKKLFVDNVENGC